MSPRKVVVLSGDDDDEKPTKTAKTKPTAVKAKAAKATPAASSSEASRVKISVAWTALGLEGQGAWGAR